MNNKIFCLLLMVLLFIPVASAQEITAEVTDKTLWSSHGYGACYRLHTDSFGDIDVSERMYSEIMIGDNITFDAQATFGCWDVLKINGKGTIYDT